MSVEVELRGVTLRYGKTTALDRLSLRLGTSQIHGLLGRNGSGKTSLLSLVAAFRRATSGEVLVDGEPVFENPSAARKVCLIRGAGDTVQHDWPGDRVRDALAFAAAVRPLWDDDLAGALVERFALPLRTHLPQLSRGQRSALGVTLGLASRAPLTIFDESYLGMDAPSRYEFYDALLSDFMAHPRTIVLATHLIQEVAALFEHVTIIDAGRLVLQAPAEDLRARGTSVMGPARAVEHFVDGLEVLATTRLGPTTSTTVFGELDDGRRREASAAGLELGPVALQDMFVHLTKTAGRSS